EALVPSGTRRISRLRQPGTAVHGPRLDRQAHGRVRYGTARRFFGLHPKMRHVSTVMFAFGSRTEAIVLEAVRIAAIAAIGPLRNRAFETMLALAAQSHSKMAIQVGHDGKRIPHQILVTNMDDALWRRLEPIGRLDEQFRTQLPAVADLSPDLQSIDLAGER